jgi:hypothetical protein
MTDPTLSVSDEHEPVYDINNSRDECAVCCEPWPCQSQRAARLAEITAAAEHDNGLAVQMARYSNDDVRWLCAEFGVLRAQRAAALELCDRVDAGWVSRSKATGTSKPLTVPLMATGEVRAALGVQAHEENRDA